MFRDLLSPPADDVVYF